MDSPTSESQSGTNKGSWWSDAEHQIFVAALQEHGKNWRKIADVVGSRSVAQVRSHAQKYFLKMRRKAMREQTPTKPLDAPEPSPLIASPPSLSYLQQENTLLRAYIQTISSLNSSFFQSLSQLALLPNADLCPKVQVLIPASLPVFEVYRNE